jgi:hypothetical protein
MSTAIIIPEGDPPLCKCGCGRPVCWNKTSEKWNICILGHSVWNPIRPIIIKKIGNNAPLCACGCGQQTKYNKQKKCWGTYCQGHGNRIMKHNDKGTPPLCECGCGLPVNWNRKKKTWFRFAYSYHACQNKNCFKKRSSTLKERYKNNILKIAKTKISIANKKRYDDNPELRKEIGLRVKKSYEDNPEKRIKQSIALKKAFNKPENKLKRSEIIKERWRNPEYRQLMSQWFKNLWKPLNRSANKPESLLSVLTPENVEFVGNGKFWRTLKLKLPDGQIITRHKNPDFLVKGQKKVIEFNGDYFHRNDYPDEVWHEAWAGIGYQVLIIWENELKDIDTVLNRVGEFVGQGSWQMSLNI